MPPSAPKLAGKAASEVRFPTWDELAAEATIDMPLYELPLGVTAKGEPDVVEIPIPDGASYLKIVRAQRTGDANVIFDELFPDELVRERVRVKMRGVHFPIIDVLVGNVLSYYYGVGLQVEAKSGNSPAS